MLRQQHTPLMTPITGVNTAGHPSFKYLMWFSLYSTIHDILKDLMGFAVITLSARLDSYLKSFDDYLNGKHDPASINDGVALANNSNLDCKSNPVLSGDYGSNSNINCNVSSDHNVVDFVGKI